MNLLALIPFIICLHPSVNATSPYEVGSTVSDFRLKNVDGKMISLSDYKNTSKGVIVIFDCNTCPYSRAYNDRIIALHHKYAPLGFPVITINSNDAAISAGDSFEEMVSKAKAKNYDFPYLHDATQRVGHAFGATNTPHAFVLKKEQDSFVVTYIGAIDNNSRNGALADKKFVEEAVNALLAGKPVEVQKTRAMGCGIQYKD
jgi:peroxiredoxin